jgi:hypothetical protein
MDDQLPPFDTAATGGPDRAAATFDPATFDPATWAAHLKLRRSLSCGEMLALLGAGTLTPGAKLEHPEQLTPPQRAALTTALVAAQGEDALLGEVLDDLLEVLLATAPDTAGASAVIGALPPVRLDTPLLVRCAERWGDDDTFWQAYADNAGTSITALETLWRQPLSRRTKQRSLAVWDATIAALFDRVRGGDSTAEHTIEAALPTPVRTLGPHTTVSSPARLLLQARLLQARCTLPARVWLPAAVRVTADLLGAVTDADHPKTALSVPVRERIAAAGSWLSVGAVAYERAADERAAAAVVALWGRHVVGLAGPGDVAVRRTMVSPSALQPLCSALDRVASAPPVGLGDTALATLARHATPADPAGELWAAALATRVVQLLSTSDADTRQWEAAASEVLRLTGTSLAVPFALLDAAGAERVWDQVDAAAGSAAFDRTGAAAPQDPSVVHVRHLDVPLTLWRDNARLLQDLLDRRFAGVEDGAALMPEGYRLALSLLDGFDGSVGDLVEVAAGSLAPPRPLS